LCIRRTRGKREREAPTRLLAVDISAFRMSGSYLLEDDDLEFTAGKRKDEERTERHSRTLHCVLLSSGYCYSCFFVFHQVAMTE